DIMRFWTKWLGAGLILVLAGTLSAQDFGGFLRGGPKVMQAFRTVVRQPSQSTVRIRCDGKDVALGTVVSTDGWIVTKDSVLTGKGIVGRFRDGRELPAKVVGSHEPYDLALLKVEARGLAPITWRESKEATVGKWVATVGPGEDPLAIGVVSVATRPFK